MLNPANLLAAIVTTYRAIPELAAAMTRDDSTVNISSYDDYYPGSVDSARALQDLKSPGMLVRYEGTVGDRTDLRGAYSHQFTVWTRSKITDAGSMERYADIGHMLINGIPAGSQQRVSNIQFLDVVYPMVFRYYMRRQDAAGLEYFEFRFDLPEIGDS